MMWKMQGGQSQAGPSQRMDHLTDESVKAVIFGRYMPIHSKRKIFAQHWFYAKKIGSGFVLFVFFLKVL